MSEDIEFKYVRCVRCDGLVRVGSGISLMDDSKVLDFCGEGCMEAWMSLQV